MSKLNRLAKLRQYQKGQDVETFMSGEFRQNMLAIEDALKIKSVLTEIVYAEILELSVPNNTASDISFDLASKIDSTNIVSAALVTIKDAGDYHFDLSFNNLVVNGSKVISLEIYIKSELQDPSFYLGYQTATTYMVHCPRVSFPMSLVAGDRVIFKIHNTSGSNSNATSIDSGLLRISKIGI